MAMKETVALSEAEMLRYVRLLGSPPVLSTENPEHFKEIFLLVAACVKPKRHDRSYQPLALHVRIVVHKAVFAPRYAGNRAPRGSNRRFPRSPRRVSPTAEI